MLGGLRLCAKAGALAAGVALARSMPVEYLAVFDGGALPKPDFLYQSIYHLMLNGKVGGGSGTHGCDAEAGAGAAAAARRAARKRARIALPRRRIRAASRATLWA